MKWKCIPDQEKRILPFAITEDAARHFFARFWGREDVYAKRSVNKRLRKQVIFHSVVISGIIEFAQKPTE